MPPRNSRPVKNSSRRRSAGISGQKDVLGAGNVQFWFDFGDQSPTSGVLIQETDRPVFMAVVNGNASGDLTISGAAGGTTTMPKGQRTAFLVPANGTASYSATYPITFDVYVYVPHSHERTRG